MYDTVAFKQARIQDFLKGGRATKFQKSQVGFPLPDDYLPKNHPLPCSETRLAGGKEGSGGWGV